MSNLSSFFNAFSSSYSFFAIRSFSTILNVGDIQAQYIRYPFAPKWTWLNLGLGEPQFDPTQSDFQEFELPDSDEPSLIAKICQYVGIEIREADVYNFGATEEGNDTQETS